MPVRLDHKILLRTHAALLSDNAPVNIQCQRLLPSPDVIRLLGDLSEEDPPVPIPNTVVKLLSPDGTARATVWESRKSPGLSSKRLRYPPEAFLCF